MNKSQITLILLLILSIATFLRLYHITSTPPGLYPDEAMNGNNAVEAIAAHTYRPFYPENNGREGLFMNIQAVLMQTVFKGIYEPWVLRIPSVLFGILTVLGIYFLGARLFSNGVGLLSTFFIAISFWHINFSRIGFRAIMSPFFLVWAICFYIFALSTANSPRRWRGWILFAIGGGLYGLGFYSYIAYRITPLLLLLLFGLYWYAARREQTLRYFYRGTVLFIAVSILVALPLGLYFLSHPQDFFGRTSELSVMSAASPLHDLLVNIAKTAGMFNVHGDENWRQNIAGAPELYWPVGILFLLGIGLGVRALFKRMRDAIGSPSSGKSFAFIFFWGVLAALPVVISDEGIPHALRAILMIPPVMILAGYGGVAAYRFFVARFNRHAVTGISGAILAILAFQGYYTYFVTWAQNPNVPGAFNASSVALAETLNALPTNVPKYVVVDAGGVLVRGIPMPATTVMFLTDTYLPQGQTAKNLHYILPDATGSIPAGSDVFHIR